MGGGGVKGVFALGWALGGMLRVKFGGGDGGTQELVRRYSPPRLHVFVIMPLVLCVVLSVGHSVIYTELQCNFLFLLHIIQDMV